MTADSGVGAAAFPVQPLGELVDFLDSRRRPITANERDPGPIPYYGANGIQDHVAGYLFDEPLVLLAEDGGHFDSPDRGIAYGIEGKAWVNNHAHVLRPRSHVDFRYLVRALENYDARPFLSGSTRAKLTKGSAARMPVPVPPIEEQRRIAAVLDQVDALRTKRREAAALLDTITESIFLDMFGDPIDNPNGWRMRTFGEVCPTRLGKMLDQKQQTNLERRTYLRNANVQWFKISIEDLAEMDFSQKDRAEFRVHPGDVLICEGGEPGRAAIWDGQVEEIYFQKALHRGRPDPRYAKPTFVVHLLRQLAVRGGLVDHISSATIAHLTGARLKAMIVPSPPIALQERFELRLHEVQRSVERASAQAAELDELFASLQQRAFRGDL